MYLNSRAIIFVHYDKNNIVDEHVYYYLKELQNNSNHLVFISTAKLSECTVAKVSQHCSKVIVRENIGYDFMSYKIGLESFNYKDYDEVVICNDSVYGPLYSLENVFEKMKESKCDFWGITDNNDMGYHLQSYFLVFKKSVIISNSFQTFWNHVKVLHDKSEIIEKYEVGLSNYLIKAGFIPSVYSNYKLKKIQNIMIMLQKFTPTKVYTKLIALVTNLSSIKRVGKINTTHYFWKEQLLTEKMPFIKIELLRDNPMNVNIDDYQDVINQISNYDVNLIINHLTRMKETK